MVLGHVFDGDRTKDVLTSQSVTFESMLLEPKTLQGLKASGFHKPSPIQLCGIPLGKCGFDLLLEAKSGTGKTAVFTVIALDKIDLTNGLQTVILAPTREIAAQICDVIKQIGSSYEGLRVEVVMGGLPFDEDVQKFKGGKVHIVVASPGRLRHLLHEKYINVSAVRLLVLDEADKLVEKSFMTDINYIFSTLPKEKQVIMSSATFPETTRTFIKNYVQNAQHVCPDSTSILLGITQKVTSVPYNSNIVKQTKYRFEELLKILSSYTFKQCLIFCNYQARVADIHKLLTKKKWPAEQLYGQQEQLHRLDALRSLQEYKCRILIATDLAARGIDASNVDLVINFEPPYDWQTYLHRIGRAGRFGSYGVAITILSDQCEQKKFTETLKAINAPIKISSLWTNTEITIDVQNGDLSNEKSNGNCLTKSSETVEEPLIVPSRIETSIDISALWKMLSSDSSDIDIFDNIVSFENLCHSFATPKLETFVDLIDSLVSHEPSNNSNNGYNHLQVPIDYLQNLSKVKEVLPTPVNKSEVTENNTASDINCVVKNDVNGEQEVNGVTKINELNKTVIEQANSSSDKYKTESFESADEYHVPNIDKDLLRAGLPTAFGSSKNRGIEDKKNNVQDTTILKCPVNIKNIEDLLKSECSENQTSKNNIKNRKTFHNSYNTHKKIRNFIDNQQFETKNTRTKKIIEASKSRESYLSFENRPLNYSTTSASTSGTSENERSTRCLSSISQYKFPKHKESQRQYQDQYNTKAWEHSKLSYQDYMNWYRNLKLRVKQIEFTIYMNELSNL